MSQSEHESRWKQLEAFLTVVRESIDRPNTAFFYGAWEEMPPAFVALLSKLRAITDAQDIEFLTSGATEDGEPTGELFAVTSRLVIYAPPIIETKQPVVEVWNRKNLNQLSVEHIEPWALPVAPDRGYGDHDSGLVIELRYPGHNVIRAPFERCSSQCAAQLPALLRDLQDDIAAIPAPPR